MTEEKRAEIIGLLSRLSSLKEFLKMLLVVIEELEAKYQALLSGAGEP